MASQISHIVYADKYLNKYPSNKINRDEFILGTVFPDIRRVAKNIKRSDTHSTLGPIDLNFNGLSSFRAGWEFHLYCDIKREEILNQHNFYSIKGTTDFVCTSSKLLEDRIIYNQYDNWKKLESFFKNPPEINTGINVSHETFKYWYAILAEYISQKPNEEIIKRLILHLPALADKADDIVGSIGELEKNKEAIKILERVGEELVIGNQ